MTTRNMLTKPMMARIRISTLAKEALAITRISTEMPMAASAAARCPREATMKL